MKFFTTRKFPFIGDYYSYKTVTTANGTVSTKVYSTVPQKIKFNMAVNIVMGGEVNVTNSDLGSTFIDSLTKMQIDGVIKNILDAKGNVLYEGGGEWKITQSAPYLGPNGIEDGYKYRLVQIAGNI